MAHLMKSLESSLLEELLEQKVLDGVNAVLASRAGEIDDQLLLELRQYAYGSLESGRVDEALSLITVGVLAARAAGDRIGELDSLLARGRIANSELGRPELVELAEDSFRSGRDLSAALIGHEQPRAIGLYFDFTAELAFACWAGERLEEARSLWSDAREHLHGDTMLEFGAAYYLAMVCYDLRDIEASGRYALMMASLYDPDGFRKARPGSEMTPPSGVCEVLYGIGLALRSAQDLETAARVFSAIIEIDRDFRDARIQLGFCQMLGADVHAAVETWKEISEDGPGNADALANYAQSLGAVGRSDEALSTINSALELKPDDHRLRMLRGGFLQSLGRHDEAAEDFKAFLATGDDDDPDSMLQARISLARSLEQAGDPGGAIDEAQRLVDQENEEAHWLGLNLLADLQASSGDTDQAIKTYEEVVGADPEDLSVRLARLDVLILAGCTETYLDELRHVARRDRDPKAALARIEELLISHPQDRELRKLRAYANLQAVEPGLAEEELTQLLADTPYDGEALHWRGLARLTSRYEPDETGWNEGLDEERIQGALGDLADAVRNSPDNQDYRNALLWLVDRALGHPYWRLWIQIMAPREDGLALVMPGLSDALVLGMVASDLAAGRHWSEAITTLHEAQDKLRALGLRISAQRIHYQLADNRVRLYQLQQALDDLERAHDTLRMYAWPLTPFLAERWDQVRADRESQRAETAAGWELEYVNVLARLFDSVDLFVADVIKADALNRIGRNQEAVAVLEKASDKIENVAETLSLGVKIHNFFAIVWIYRDADELARANEFVQRLKPFVESDEDRVVLLGLEASLLEREGRLEEAFVKYREVQPIASKLGQGLPFINANQLAANCCERGAFGGALEVLNGADLDAARSENDLFGYHINRARTLHGLDRAGEALPEVRAALAIVEDLRSHFTLYESRTSWLGRKQPFFDIAVRIAADADDPAEAFLLTEKAQARTFLDQLIDVEMAAPGSEHPLQGTVRNVNDLREVLTELLDTVVHHGSEFVDFERLQRLQAIDSTITVVDSSATEGALTLSADKLRKELRKIETAMENLKRRIEEETLAEMQSSEGAVASFDELRALLESEERLIGDGRRLVLAEYYVMGDLTLLFLLRSDFSAPKLCRLEFGVQQLVDNVEVVQAALDKEHPTFGDSFDRLFGTVVEPILSVARDNDVLWIVPHRALHYFPLHLVRTSQRYLGERNPIFYSPSASVLPQTLSRRRPRTQRAIVFGDPENNLPFAREEAIKVAELLGATPLLGAHATKANLLSELDAGGSFDVVHLACHGYFNYDDPMASGIVLAPGAGAIEPVYLTAGELSRLRMSASLVALSACETGQNFQREGDELVGLTRALFRAGAASLLVSSWEISDVATTFLLRRFYQLLGDVQGSESPPSKCDALRAAQRFVRNLTAADLIKHCNERLESLSEAGDVHVAIQIGMAIADARIVAYDLEAATASYDALAARASMPDPSFAELRERIDSAREYLSARRERGGVSKPDYSVKPFDDPYFWGGFVLQGNWR